MLSYYLKCKNNTENVHPIVLKTKNGKTTISWKCAVCGSKNSRLKKEWEGNGLLNSLGIKSWSNVPLLGKVLFSLSWMQFFGCHNDLIVVMAILSH